MNTFTKVLIYIGIILAWCNQISAMRPILKDEELPPYEARLEPDREPKSAVGVVDTDFTRELEIYEERNPDTGDIYIDEYLFEEYKKNLTEPKPELLNGTITNSTNVHTSSVWTENQFSDFEKSSAGLIGLALLPFLTLAFKV